ncbi:hypothetical protein PVK06_024391 [Gossypium arboreum]|uniref:Uncharacterized protein n=1 Tax=Gossypium arboreum TaxID=29729 RepID=A0ABR0PDR1_GOSAR|nr:hypothetical protein PVK06_024391 [Gossypium arboreum]
MNILIYEGSVFAQGTYVFSFASFHQEVLSEILLLHTKVDLVITLGGYGTILWGEAVSTLVGHTQCVSSVVWPQHDTIYSTSTNYSEKPTTLDCGPRTTCRRHIMTGSYLYECLWEALQQRIRMVLINMQLTPYVL